MNSSSEHPNDSSSQQPAAGDIHSSQNDAWRQRFSETLRTRLNAIIGFSELLSLEPLSPNGRNDLKQILKNARELLDVVERELAASDGHAGDRSATTRGQLRTCDLLYIEDDIANVTLVERILELRPSLSLKHATHGQRGLELAKTENPKLILLDLNLPDMHGADVLNGLHANSATSEIPVVVLSANAIPTQIERLLAAGARNYLTKPFELDHFLAVVDEWTRRV